MNHSINIATATACHKQVYFKMTIAKFFLCLTVLQFFLDSCQHTCHWEVREMVLVLSLITFGGTIYNSYVKEGEGSHHSVR